MPSPFYYYTETYSGSEILVSVERNTGTYDSPTSGPVPLHTVIGYIDTVETVPAEDNPLHGVDSRPGLDSRLPAIIQILRDEIDSKDDFDVIMEGLSFDSGSDPITGFTVTPTSGGFDLDWDDDPDVDIESIQQATVADYSDAYTTHSGALSPVIHVTGLGSGVTRYWRIRGQRSGFPPGPWSYGSGTTL